jgi:hypothetical protein
MRTTLLCLALCTGLVPAGPTGAASAPAAAACKSTVSGDLRLHALKSTIFGVASRRCMRCSRSPTLSVTG